MPETSQAPISDGVVTTTHCESVDEFVAALSPRSIKYRSLYPHGWVFRGHADDDYELVPTALRNESENLRAFTNHEITNNTCQVWAEKRVLDEFLHASDSIGLHVPEDSQNLRTLLDIRAPLPNCLSE